MVKRMFETTSKRIYSTEETRQRVLADSDVENNDLEELNSQESLSDSESGWGDSSPTTAVPDEPDEDDSFGEDLNSSFEQCCKIGNI